MTDDRLTPGGAPRADARTDADRARLTDPSLLTPDAGDVEPQSALTGRPVTEVHQWLDGEGTEAAARQADARDAEMWAKLNAETERRGRMVTPAPVLDRLMQAIPAEPKAQDDGVLGKVKKLFGK